MTAPNLKNKQAPLMLQTIVMIGALLIVAAFVRFWNLGAESFWFDEFILIEATSNSGNVTEQIQAGRPPLIVILGYLWGGIFGFDEASIRALPAIMGVASVALIYFIGQKLFNWQIALMSAILSTFSGFLIYHSQDYRYYSLLTLTSLLSYWFFIQLLWTGKRRYVIPYAICTCLVYYSHLYGIFVIFAQGVYFLLRWQRHKELRFPWLSSQVFIAAITLPHFAVLFTGDFRENSSIDFLSLSAWNHPVFVTIRYIFYNDLYLRPIPLIPALITFVAGIGIVIASRKGEWLQQIRQDIGNVLSLFTKQTDATLLILTWFFCVMFTPYVLSYILGPLFYARYVIPSAPAFYLILGVGLWTFRKSIPLIVSMGALLIVMVLGLAIYYVEPIKEDWRSLFTDIVQNEEANHVIFYKVASSNTRSINPYYYAANTYYDGNLEICPYYEDLLTDTDFNTELRNCAGEADYVWVVMRAYNRANQRIEGLSTYLSENFEAQFEEQTHYQALYLVEYTLPTEQE